MRGVYSTAQALIAFVALSGAVHAAELYGPADLPAPDSSYAVAPGSDSETESRGESELESHLGSDPKSQAEDAAGSEKASFPSHAPAEQTALLPEVSLPASEKISTPAAQAAPVVVATAPAAPPVPEPEPQSYGPLKIPEGMLPRVKFWVDVYARTFSWEFRIHDTRHPELTYSVLNTKGKPKGSMPAEKLRVLGVLRSLKAKLPKIEAGKLARSKLSAEEARILAVFERENLVSELPAAATEKRIRGQAGLRDTLEDSLFVSGRYLPRMEELFERFGLPKEIAYLPFVESGFNKKAVSKVGASGIWQFMPYTGKLYLRVDDVVDERNDPMRAGEAAARLMAQNHAMLEEWPLAMTAYNHGPMGVARAVREVGTRSLASIIDKYDGKTFGFASQNFYASFLGAMHVAKHSDYYLGAIPRAKKLEFDEFIMPDFMDLHVFLGKMAIDEPMFRELNMALTREVWEGRKYIPVGYTVRVPTEFRDDFLTRYEAIPAEFKFSRQKGGEVYGPPAPSSAQAEVDPDLKDAETAPNIQAPRASVAPETVNPAGPPTT